VDTVVFDKTGTVTLGKPRVTYVRPAKGASERDVVEAAAIAERRSEHPLGQAILDKAAELSLPAVEPERFDYTPGKGIVCTSGGQEILVGSQTLFREKGLDTAEVTLGAADPQSQVLVARAGRVLGAIGVADVLRADAEAAVAALHAMGLRTVLLTGDAAAIAGSVASRLGIDNVQAELLPEDKVARVKALRAEGRNVVMVGDGINDAPALMEADLGVAMGGGTDVARESADVVLIGNELSKFAETVKIARWCRRIIYTNFTGTLVVDAIGVGLAAFGLLNPLVAALIHVVSELAFILNSARLLPAVSHDRSAAAKALSSEAIAASGIAEPAVS
jgi:Cd2+/Zn2+-exporting ATPase/Cu+-exporting ATPase